MSNQPVESNVNVTAADVANQLAALGEPPETSTSHLPMPPAEHVYFSLPLWAACTQYLAALPRSISRDLYKAASAALTAIGIDPRKQPDPNTPSHVPVHANVLGPVLQFINNRPSGEVDELMTHVEKHLEIISGESAAAADYEKKKASLSEMLSSLHARETEAAQAAASAAASNVADAEIKSETSEVNEGNDLDPQYQLPDAQPSEQSAA